MGALYYIPARRFPDGRVPDMVKPARLTPEGAASLESLGLGHLAEGPLTFRVVRNSGPDGGAGLVIGLRIPAGETGVFLSDQTWHPCEGGAVYLGWYTAAGQPGPEVFLRARAPRPTVSIPLGDGQVWGFVESDALPQRAVFDASGERAWAPRESDALHYEACAWLADYAQCGEGRAYFDILDQVSVCLSARYHVSALEVLGLGLFSTDLNDAVVYACLGVDLADDEKKSDSASAV